MRVLTDCPVCGGAAVVSFGKDPRFAGMRSNGWGDLMGYTARCNFSNCHAPSYTRESADAAGAAWNSGVAGWPNA